MALMIEADYKAQDHVLPCSITDISSHQSQMKLHTQSAPRRDSAVSSGKTKHTHSYG